MKDTWLLKASPQQDQINQMTAILYPWQLGQLDIDVINTAIAKRKEEKERKRSRKKRKGKSLF